MDDLNPYRTPDSPVELLEPPAAEGSVLLVFTVTLTAMLVSGGIWIVGSFIMGE